MDVRLSAEQRALRDSVVQLVDRLGPGSVADLHDAERVAKLDAAVAASGWRELRAADDAGAPWASAVEAAIVAEELGRGLADAAFLGPVLAADLRRRAGAPPATVPETVVMTTDLAAPADDGGVVLDGAGAAVALAIVGAGTRVATVKLSGGTDTGVDLTRQLAVLPASAVPEPIADCALAADDLVRYTAFGLVLSCADLVGVMRGTTALARDYAVIRQQYGSLIGSYQAVQHLLADAFVATAGSSSLALHAAWAVDALPPSDALAAAAAAKAYCARAARTVCETSIQVHGGIGNTWECLAHVYLRRALVSSDLFGGVGANLDRVLSHHEIGVGNGVR